MACVSASTCTEVGKPYLGTECRSEQAASIEQTAATTNRHRNTRGALTCRSDVQSRHLVPYEHPHWSSHDSPTKADADIGDCDTGCVDHIAVLREVVQWAEGDENVRALILEGSVGRGDSSVDEWSDLDLRVYVNEPGRLLERREWFERFGDVLVVEALENPGWYPTRLVYYVDGKIDFMIAPVASLRDRSRFGRRVRILVDKDALTAAIEQGEPPGVTVPDRAAFLVCVNEFYAAALMCARMLVRDEPVKAKFRDWDMKTRLFEMIAWDHQARYGSTRDVRPFGTNFRKWVDPAVAEELERCWSDLRVDTSYRALHATVALFRTSSERATSAIGVQPFVADAVIEEIARIAKASTSARGHGNLGG